MTVDTRTPRVLVSAAQTPAPVPVKEAGVRVINCNDCRENLPETEFAFKNKETGRRSTKCKPCMRVYAKGNYRANRSARIAAANKRNVVVRSETRAEVAAMLADVSCADCARGSSVGNDLIVVLPGDGVTGGRRLGDLIASGWPLPRIRGLVAVAASSGAVLCRQCLGKRCGAQNRQSLAAHARALEAALLVG